MSIAIQTSEQLCTKKCVPCEGGVPKFTPGEAEEQIKQQQESVKQATQSIRQEIERIETRIKQLDEIGRAHV